MWGVTTPCVTVARERLEELGYEVLVFHQVGLGGHSLEEVVKTGRRRRCARHHHDGTGRRDRRRHLARGPERLETAGRLGIPQVVSLGGARRDRHDRPAGAAARALRRPADLPPRRRPGRDATTAEECREVAAILARKLNAATGPTVLFVPLRGLSLLSTEGAVLHDSEADEALFSDAARARRPVEGRGARGRRRRSTTRSSRSRWRSVCTSS